MVIKFLNAWTCLFSLLIVQNMFWHLCSWTQPNQGFKPTQTFFLEPLFGCQVWFVIVLFSMQSWRSTCGLTWLPILILFQVRLNLRPLWHSVCDVHSGNTQWVPLRSWLAVKTSSLFRCLLPQDIKLYPLTPDITTWLQVFYNCSGEKTRCWCLSLFAQFPCNLLQSSHECFTLKSHTVHLSVVLLCIINL